MRKIVKIFSVTLMLSTAALFSFADRGVRKKSKTSIILNIASNNTFKNTLAFNLKTGLKYNTTLLNSSRIGNSNLLTKSIYSYQKGNTYYVVSRPQKSIVADYKQGYTGFKLIIKPKN
jgi:hypothetical protein